MTPFIEAAATQLPGIPHTANPITTAEIHAMGIARVAGHRNPTIRMPAIKSGAAANSSSTALTMETTSAGINSGWIRLRYLHDRLACRCHSRRVSDMVYICTDASGGRTAERRPYGDIYTLIFTICGIYTRLYTTIFLLYANYCKREHFLGELFLNFHLSFIRHPITLVCRGQVWRFVGSRKRFGRPLHADYSRVIPRIAPLNTRVYWKYTQLYWIVPTIRPATALARVCRTNRNPPTAGQN